MASSAPAETAAPVSAQAAPVAPVAAQSPAPGGEGDETFDGEEGLTLRALVSSKEAGELLARFFFAFSLGAV